MRLLHAQTYQLVEFFEGRIPPYAILSHCWGPANHEVSFKDMEDLRVAQRCKAWPKITNCCRRAIKDGYEWVWIDTCCIDKSGSAELSEAINSMWQYYKDAQICYGYLGDVAQPSSRIRDDKSMQALLAPSRWFTRGWTLQELMGPAKMVFLASDWSQIGDKASLGQVLSSITGIEVEYLLGADLSKACIAQKMCWAAKRNTSRSEDLAYCLLGIFGINMPVIYGEGKGAFRRLQEELMRTSGDQTIFAWTQPSDPSKYSGVLADSPAAFAASGDVRPHDTLTQYPFSLTNQGIRIQVFVMQEKSARYTDGSYRHKGLLLCRKSNQTQALGIHLRESGTIEEVKPKRAIGHHSYEFPVYERTMTERLCSGTLEMGYLETIYIR